MAKVVIAGRADCPYLARVELLGDQLSKNLPDFQLHKIVKTKEEWDHWLVDTCQERGWNHGKSPLVWRELIDRGGKGVLIGGANEFQEYVAGYYGLQSDMSSQDMIKVAEENKTTKTEVDTETRELKAQSKPLQICMTNASSPVCYSLLNMVASGEVFGPGMEVALRLHDSAHEQQEYLAGVQMETADLAHGLLRDVRVDCDLREALKDCSMVLLLDEVRQTEDESREMWLQRNAQHFTHIASILNDVATKNVKVLLAGSGPLNFNAYMMIKHAPNIPRQNIVALSRVVENSAKSVMGQRLAVNPAGVVDLVIWGNINSKNYIDVSKARVHGYDGAIWGPPSFSVSAREMVHDDKWLEKEYVELVEGRQSKVAEALGHPASNAQALAIASTVNHWFNGSPQGQMFSLGVCSEGWYNVPEGLVFSFPVTMSTQGFYNIVQDVELSEEVTNKIQDIVQELMTERDAMLPAPPADAKTNSKESGHSATEEKGQDTLQDTDNGRTDEKGQKGDEENGKEGGEENGKEGGEENGKEGGEENGKESEEEPKAVSESEAQDQTAEDSTVQESGGDNVAEVNDSNEGGNEENDEEAAAQ